ncbi:MAG: hypothetical protein JWO80_4979, partial [Bryobacterales bacterium]|nr:hypothetical protein [Bryobacterales bacterium]
GIFRDAADFAVLILWDADNFYEHPRLKYLPDFNFSGAVLTFDVQYSPGLQPLDSPKFDWIDWAKLDYIRADGKPNTVDVRLSDHAVLQSPAFPAASGTFDLVTGPAGIQSFDRVTLFFQNFAYDFIAPVQNASVEYQFFAAGLGALHTVNVNGRPYTHTESNPAGESSTDVVNALVALINAGAGDAQVTAAIGSLPNSVLLTAKPGATGSGIPVTSTGNIGTTLGATSLSDVAAALAQEINSTDWWTTIPTQALRATAGASSVTLTAGRYGTVAVAGTSVTWLSGAWFTGIVPGSTITIAGLLYTVASIQTRKSLTLAASAGAQTSARYVADRGGVDGNMIELYALNKTDSLKTAQPAVRLSGGASDVTWRCTIDFTALQIDQLRQCWLTFAPALANSQAYTATEWQATFSNWTLNDPNGVCRLSVAGPNSVRVEDTSTACTYTGAWATAAPETGFYSGGLAKRAGSPGLVTNETVSIRYSCSQVHDLYLGTSLYRDRATVGVQLDGDTEADLDCRLQTEPAVNTRRKLRAAVAPGTHTVKLRVKTTGYFYLDFIEAAVLSDIPAPPPARSNISPALDYSTDHSYKLPPARIMWIFDNLGFTGPVNQYIGVFWWNERTNLTAQFPSVTVSFNGSWAAGDTAQLIIGGTAVVKTVLPADTTSTIAAHFARYINEVFVGAWAQATLNTLTITSRSPAFTFTFSKSATSSAGTLTVTGSLQGGRMGTWVVDPSQTPAVNRGARDWHSDLYTECRNRNREIVTSGSMELVNPPAGFAAIFPDGQPVVTDVGFGNLRSTHCAQSSPMLAYQTAMFDCITDLQNAAGLVPNVQFGEYLWWFFTNYSASNPTGGMAYCDPETQAAAQAALGRPLHRFLDPNDNPNPNSADAVFLRNRLRDHVAALVNHIHARYPAAQCEMLFAYDVNYPKPANGVGGALNNFINFPPEWGAITTAGFNRLKVEALSFGGNSRNLDLARTAIQFPLQHDWPLASIRYLAPIFVQSTTWEKEVAMALSRRIPVVNLWAFDQMCIFGLNIVSIRDQSRGVAFGM